MAIYVDDAYIPKDGKRWCHMATDGDLEKLHLFAEQLGLKRSYLHNGGRGRFPHYDVAEQTRARAIALGAVVVSGDEFLRRCFGVGR